MPKQTKREITRCSQCPYIDWHWIMCELTNEDLWDPNSPPPANCPIRKEPVFLYIKQGV